MYELNSAAGAIGGGVRSVVQRFGVLGVGGVRLAREVILVVFRRFVAGILLTLLADAVRVASTAALARTFDPVARRRSQRVRVTFAELVCFNGETFNNKFIKMNHHHLIGGETFGNEWVQVANDINQTVITINFNGRSCC